MRGKFKEKGGRVWTSPESFCEKVFGFGFLTEWRGKVNQSIQRNEIKLGMENLCFGKTWKSGRVANRQPLFIHQIRGEIFHFFDVSNFKGWWNEKTNCSEWPRKFWKWRYVLVVCFWNFFFFFLSFDGLFGKMEIAPFPPFVRFLPFFSTRFFTRINS